MSFTVTAIILGIAAVVGLILLLNSIYTVDQQTTAILQRMGKFVRVSGPGFQFKFPLIDSVSGRLNMRVQQLNVEVETKTKDNVFVKMLVSVQYHVIIGKEYEAFYKLNDPHGQIQSYVFDVVRARVPKILLDDVFERKDEIADAVKAELRGEMDDFGYSIIKALVTDIDPDPKVKASMNEINAAQRERVAATEKGEAEKILKIKQAEAEAESKALQGKGIANQRKAIIDGLKDSVDDFQKAIQGADAKDVMNLVLITQYLDTLKDVAGSDTKVLFLNHSPGAMADLAEQMQRAIVTGKEA